MLVNWTLDQDRGLRERWGKMPAAQIALEVGAISKNAVIARAHRLHLEQLQRTRPRRTTLQQAGPKALATTLVPEARKPLRIVSIDYTTTRLLDAAFDQCRAIEGEIFGADTLVCGKQVVSEKSYCPTHLALFYGRRTTEKPVVVEKKTWSPLRGKM